MGCLPCHCTSISQCNGLTAWLPDTWQDARISSSGGHGVPLSGEKDFYVPPQKAATDKPCQPPLQKEKSRYGKSTVVLD